MAYYFDREDVALDGFHRYFLKQSQEEREHAQSLMKYQNQRGGTVRLLDIRKPAKGEQERRGHWGSPSTELCVSTDAWGSPLDAVTDALALEKKVNESLLKLHEIADKNGDAQMCDFLESHFLTEQVQAIKELTDHITNIKRVGPGLGEYLFDKKTLAS